MRKNLIADIGDSGIFADRELYDEYRSELRKVAGWRHLMSSSGRYPKTARGRINTYAIFAEAARTVIGASGRSGLVLPTGIATDATTAPFFSDLVRTSTLVSFLEFENEPFLLSKDVDHRVRFCLLTVSGTPIREASFAFGTRYMHDLPSRRFAMPPEEILLVNPNTGTSPVFRSRRDAEITIGIYRRVPVLWRETPDGNIWDLAFMQGLYNMASDSGLFRTSNDLEADGWTLKGNAFGKESHRMLPLYEAKMIHFFDHRYGTYQGQTEAQANMGTLPRLSPTEHDDPNFVIQPRYWVPEFDTLDEQRSKPNKPVYHQGVESRLNSRHWDRGWLLGWRDICRSTDERTVICGAIPRTAAGHKFPLAFVPQGTDLLYANLSSLVLDYVARQKISGTSMTYFVLKQLPVPLPAHYDNPVAWLSQTQLARRHEDRQIGEFRTKRLILERYDSMAEAARTGTEYQTVLDPPPGHGVRHAPRLARS